MYNFRRNSMMGEGKIKEVRRGAKSKDALKKALLELLKEKDFG